jgi:hypothetical protein
MAQDFFYYIAATASRGWLTCSTCWVSRSPMISTSGRVFSFPSNHEGDHQCLLHTQPEPRACYVGLLTRQLRQRQYCV